MSDLHERFWRWLLLDGDRITIAVVLVGATFATLTILGHFDAITLSHPAAIRGVASAFIPGLVAFLSIVLGINQLVLSQEFGSTEEIRGRIESIRGYREDVEQMAAKSPSPVMPVGFLDLLVRTIQAEARALEATVGRDTDPAVREAVVEYADGVESEAAAAHESLEQLQPGRINALLPVLEYDDSSQLYEARRLQREYAGPLPAETAESLSRLVTTLELFSVARTKFRSTYTQRVLARLSRQLLYVGVPAVLVVVVLSLYPATSPGGVGLGGDLLVGAALAFAVSPLAVLAAYLLRVAAVSERTVAVGPFVSRPGRVRSERDD